MRTLNSFIRLIPAFATALLFVSVPGAPAGRLDCNYDADGRLSSAQYADGKRHEFLYDVSGNLLVNATSIPAADTDLDGMDDAWETLYFGNKDARDGTGDFDNDGFNDLNEFLAGTLPNNSTSLLKLTQTTPTAGSGVTIQWACVPGKNYRVQFKNALTDPDWQNVTGDVLATGATSSKADATISGQHARFYRVQLLP